MGSDAQFPADDPSRGGASSHRSDAEEEDRLGNQGHQGPVIRDKRRLDPETGQVRPPAPDLSASPGPHAPGAADSPGPSPEVSAPGGPDAPREADNALDSVSVALAAERLADLQRLQAEYVNYRKRVERDRDVARDHAIAGVLESLLPVLDDIHLAREHGDLEGGPFAAIADKLDAVLTRYGLQRFGAVGEPFDPAVHEALMHSEAELGEGVDVTTVTQVLQPGYSQGDRVLRAARVAVADPA